MFLSRELGVKKKYLVVYFFRETGAKRVGSPLGANIINYNNKSKQNKK